MSMIREGVVLIAGAMAIAACSTTPMIGSGPASCSYGELSAPGLDTKVAFEDAAMCTRFGGAFNRRAAGNAGAADQDEVSVIDWIAASFTATDVMMIDRFGRAQLMRCGTDPDADYPVMQSGLKYGEGEEEREVFMTITLPPTAEQCQETQS